MDSVHTAFVHTIVASSQFNTRAREMMPGMLWRALTRRR